MRLQTDGGLKTGLDVIKAAMLGAESFGFGTAPMVALGCKYLRICHLNNCATGVATQHDVLRSNYFIGLPEMVINYLPLRRARKCAMIMATLGVRTLAELIGRVDLLELVEGQTPQQRRLDLSPLLSDSGLAKDAPQFCSVPTQRAVRQGRARRADARRPCRAAIDGQQRRRVRNTTCRTSTAPSARACPARSRAATATTACAMRRSTCDLTGTAGQSFGAWNAGGLQPAR